MLIVSLPLFGMAWLLGLGQGVDASLKHTDSVVFQKLADLTRSPSERVAASTKAASLNKISTLSMKSERYGLDWETSYTESLIEQLITGQQNADGLSLLSLGMKNFHQHARRDAQNSQNFSNSRNTDDVTDNGHQTVRKQGDRGNSSTFHPIKPPSIPLAVKSPCK